jgi:Domain of Unknown Function (DUF1259)
MPVSGMARLTIALRLSVLSVALFSLPAPASAQDMPSDYKDVLTILARKGDFAAGVLKVGIPRNDLQVSIAGVAAPTALGFGGWLGFTKADGGNDVMMGDLVLLQDEVNPVMSALLEHGVAVTALHNHFFWEEPRIFYMHVHGYGKAADLAHDVNPALDLIGRNVPPPSSIVNPTSPPGHLDTERIAAIVGHQGDINGLVYKITLGRSDLTVKHHGATINARMGLNTWAAFAGSDESAIVAGDVAMLADEVTPVLKALRKNNLEVVAIHHHMIGVEPQITFLHYWGKGSAAKLATGFRAALDVLAKPDAATHSRGE